MLNEQSESCLNINDNNIDNDINKDKNNNTIYVKSLRTPSINDYRPLLNSNLNKADRHKSRARDTTSHYAKNKYRGGT